MTIIIETHVITRVPAVIKTWGGAVRRESLGVCHGQSTVIGRVLRVGITGNSVCLSAYHWQMDFSAYWTWLAVLRLCFSSGTAADGHTPYKTRPSQNWPKITTYDHVQQILRDLDVEFCVTGALDCEIFWHLSVISWVRISKWTFLTRGALLLSESVGTCRPLDPLFSPQAHPLVGSSNVKHTLVGHHFFVLSHYHWVIFVKFSNLNHSFGVIFVKIWYSAWG